MYESVESGEINRVPLIIGINSEEQISKIAGLFTFLFLIYCKIHSFRYCIQSLLMNHCYSPGMFTYFLTYSPCIQFIIINHNLLSTSFPLIIRKRLMKVE